MGADGFETEGAIFLMFEPGARPHCSDLRNALTRCQSPAHVSHELSQDGFDLVELVVKGLTFDCTGLAPGEGARMPAPTETIGFDDLAALPPLEALSLRPAPHLAGGGRMAPVLRTMFALAAELAMCLPTSAVLWQPAGIAMAPAHFSRITLAWLAGGMFPAPGLVALAAGADRAVASRGLGYFAGQEFRVEQGGQETAAQTLALAARLADHLVAEGPVTEPIEVTIAGEPLFAEPARLGDQVWFWRRGVAAEAGVAARV